GDPGVQGPPGADGVTTYTWVKYSNSSNGIPMQDSHVGMTYIGFAFNKTTATESTTPGDYQWSLIQGPQGNQGIPGEPGTDGITYYTWLKYASSSTPAPADMSDSPTGKTYMGIAVGKTSPTETTVYTDYNWSLIQGPQGNQGIPGEPGVDGTTTYTWVKYAPNGTPSDGQITDTPVTGTTHIGLAFNKTTATESPSAAQYQWSLIQGPQGPQGNQGIPGVPGDDGITYYTWLKYASSATPAPADMSDSPVGKTYLGLAYNKLSQTETTVYTDYTWSLIKGDQGDPGIPGTPGDDGITYYTWVKYAPNADGTGLQDSHVGMTYIGLAFNKTTSVKSLIKTDYAWSKIVGDPGTPGTPGVGIVSVTPYFRIGTTVPAKPTTNPPPSPWQTTEPAWVEGQMMYRTELIVYTSGSPGFAYTDVSTVAAFQAADAAMQAANGKNVVTYTGIGSWSSLPALPTTTGRITGDIHRVRYTDTGEIAAEYTIINGAWIRLKYGDAILTSLDVGKLSAGTATIQTSVIEFLWTKVVN